MTIIDLKTHPVAHWKQNIIDHYPFLPYWWIRDVTPESRQALMRRELEEASATNRTCLLGYTSDKGDLRGFAQMRWMEWDTNHFGFEIWRLEHLGAWGNPSQRLAIAQALVQKVIQSAHEGGGENIQVRIPIDNLLAIQALESAGFRTMETLITLAFNLAKSPILAKKNPDLIRDFESGDTESLVELSRTAYALMPDRFHMDPHLSQKASDEMYAEWTRNSCSGQLADHIAVAESKGKIIGYVAVKYHGDCNGICNARIAQWGVGTVSPDFRRRGIFSDLIIHNLESLTRRQADYCFGGTQGNNIPQQRALLKAGLKPAMTAISLHYWANDQA